MSARAAAQLSGNNSSMLRLTGYRLWRDNPGRIRLNVWFSSHAFAALKEELPKEVPSLHGKRRVRILVDVEGFVGFANFFLSAILLGAYLPRKKS
jgi:hypothetical protein